MVRRVSLLVCVVTLASAAWVDLHACGDKFLRIGRSARPNAYAAVHRASILLYVPVAKLSDVKEYESFLKRAGHHPLPVRDMKAFSDALAEGKYDIVITPLVQASQLKDLADSARSKPDLVPIVPKSTKAELTEIGRQYPHTLEAGATRIDALAEIDRVMELRLSTRR